MTLWTVQPTIETAPAGETVGRQPFGHGVGIEVGAVDPFGRRAKNAVEFDGACGHDSAPFDGELGERADETRAL